MAAPPPATRRLFAHYEFEDLDFGQAESLLIGRLLEEGETTDLTWLVTSVGEARLADWLKRAGGRQLSVRGRRFWEVVLSCEAARPAPGSEDLWPL